MIVICAAYGVALLIFVLIYFGIYNPLYSHPFPGDIIDVIPVVSTVNLAELERWVSEEMSNLLSETLTPKEQRMAKRRRCKMIAARLVPVEANAKLILAFTRQQVRVLRSKPPGPRSERDRLIEELFERAQYCCLLLTFAKATRILMPWDTRRLIHFHRQVVTNETRQLLFIFVQLSATYGERCRENLLAALDVWELADETR